jgi:hemerythrin superfamily protein
MAHQSLLRNELLQQHERLEITLRALLDAAESVDPQDLQRVWTTFETELTTHLESEEKELFPLVEAFHPEEVWALRIEHERIRGLVAELGICCDLHSLNRANVLDLVQTLRHHAEREDRTLYRWLEELAPLDTRRHLLGLLKKTVQAGVAGGK